jgi:hypothetical protein
MSALSARDFTLIELSYVLIVPAQPTLEVNVLLYGGEDNRKKGSTRDYVRWRVS